MKTHKRGLLVNSSNVALRTGAAVATLWIGALASEAVAQNTILEGVQEQDGTPTVVCTSTNDSILITTPGSNGEIGCNAGGSVAIGRDSEIAEDASSSVAIGSGAKATASNAIAMGTAANAGSDGIAFGRNSSGGRFGIGLGVGATAFEDSIAIGRSSSTDGVFGIALGVAANALEDALAIGRSSDANGTFAIAIGVGSKAGEDAFAVGRSSTAEARGSLAIGLTATTSITAINSVALGGVANAGAASSVAIGFGSGTTGANSVAIGAGANDGGRGNVLAVGSATGTRRTIINMANGSVAAGSNEAITGAQLFSTNAAITTGLGAGAAINATTGAFTAPAFTVVGGTFNNVGTALDAIDAQLANALIYDNPGHTSATLGGAGATAPVALRNVSAATLNSTSTDAVNGSQLFAINQRVTTNTGHIAATVAGLGGGAAINSTTGAFTAPVYTAVGGSFDNVGEALAALDDELSGAVFYDDASRTRATLGAVGGSVPVSLENVGTGVLNATSTDAVNGSQLFATNENVASLGVRVGNTELDLSSLNNGIETATIGIVQQTSGAPGAGEIRIGAATGGTSLSLLGIDGERSISGMRAGLLSAGSTEGVNGSQLFATNQLVDANSGSISNIQTSLGDNVTAVSNLTTAVQNGTIGIVQQDSATLQIGVGTNVGGVSVNFAGTDGNRLLSGLSAANLGATSSDAVNGSQLFATNQLVTANSSAIGLVETRVTTIEGSLGTNISNVSNLTTAIQNGTIGIVQQDPATQNITVGGNTGGALINLSGTSGNRVITGLGAGAVSAASTEAVNGSQLHATNQIASDALQAATNANGGIAAVAAALGGGASFNASNGTFTGPTFNVSGSSFDDVGSALLALDDSISSVSVAATNSVQYDDPARSAVTLGGTGSATPVALKNVQAGALATGSTDAVNGSQLHATNLAIATNTTAISSLDTRVTNIEGSVIGSNQAVTNLTSSIQNGTIGIVQQDPATQDINVGAQVGGNAVNLTGAAGSRTLRGVRAGAVSSNSSEAVNGSQLYALQQSVDSGISRVENQLTGLGTRVDTIELDLRKLRGSMNSAVASAIAIGMLPSSTNPGRFTLGMGTGVRSGQMATALGISYRTTDDMFTMQARAAFDKEAVSVGVGMGLEF
jgi:autotransporter adhesin